MKKIIRTILTVLFWTVGFPWLLAMALGYWMEDDRGLSYWEAVKRCAK